MVLRTDTEYILYMDVMYGWWVGRVLRSGVPCTEYVLHTMRVFFLFDYRGHLVHMCTPYGAACLFPLPLQIILRGDGCGLFWFTKSIHPVWGNLHSTYRYCTEYTRVPMYVHTP